jgi:hypothetical protein
MRRTAVFVTVQEHFIAYCRSRYAAKLFFPLVKATVNCCDPIEIATDEKTLHYCRKRCK